MPEARLELARILLPRILNPVCLPLPSLGQVRLLKTNDLNLINSSPDAKTIQKNYFFISNFLACFAVFLHIFFKNSVF